ncbi:MAG: IS200/IS605 family transposase [Thermoguttaceae bacterium]
MSKNTRPVRATQVEMPQSLSQIFLHIIFSTKSRQCFFQDNSFENDHFGYLAGICKKQDCHAKIIGGYVDHVHILCSLSRTKTVAELVKAIKANSTIWIKEKQPSWRDFCWQQGYGVFSVSPSQVDHAVEYIKNQKLHHKEMSFQDEYRKFLNKHNVVFDENHVWN